jgi:hypothetical protein
MSCAAAWREGEDGDSEDSGWGSCSEETSLCGCADAYARRVDGGTDGGGGNGSELT